MTSPPPLPSEHDLLDQEIARRQKLERLRQAGVDPYPPQVQRSHTIAQALAAYESGELAAGHPPVHLAGRMVSRRVMGKVAFAHIEDGSGRVQIMLQQNLVGADGYDFFQKNLDLGDIVGVSGGMITTRTGEVTCQAAAIVLLAKTLKPMPDKWRGLRDPEVRQRQRYLDLLANPEGRDIFRLRAAIVRALRAYLDGQDFLEVETPILQPLYGGAAAEPFVTHHNYLHQDLYLRISFELYLKRLLVGGYDRVYEIGRDFRNEGISYKHNPEFTQLEFYEAYTDYHGVMRRTEEMLCFVAEQVTGGWTIRWGEHSIDFTPPWPRIPLRQAIIEASGIDYELYRDAEGLRAAMRARGIDAAADASRGKLIDKLLSHFVEPTLIQPTFLIDYPLDVSPLAKRKPGTADTVERFEGFAGGFELCNAFSELNDPLDQLQRFIDQGRDFAAGDKEAHPVDEDYVNALSYGMPPAGGFGMGIDRLTMLFTGQDNIREVILFPHLRPEA
ncbi:MAG: lysine--tRNA ligase [Caldilineales bacterium]|nr:lysine--tRNA ligase [Caldilineales bacterium]MCW5857199.1 lysine--tRNA ligase [Caldilineales bacterium]